jgi:hypothetical protein
MHAASHWTFGPGRKGRCDIGGGLEVLQKGLNALESRLCRIVSSEGQRDLAIFFSVVPYYVPCARTAGAFFIVQLDSTWQSCQRASLLESLPIRGACYSPRLVNYIWPEFQRLLILNRLPQKRRRSTCGIAMSWRKTLQSPAPLNITLLIMCKISLVSCHV